MPQAGIPFVNHEESGHEELAGASPAAHNVVLDEKGAIRRRPGLTQYTGAEFNSAGDPVHWVHRGFDGDLYVATGPDAGTGRSLYRMAGKDAGAIALGSMSATGRLMSVETEGLIALAGGLEPHRIKLLDKTFGLLGGNPPKATHIIGTAGRLVATDPAQPAFFRWSGLQYGTDITNHEVWDEDAIAGADARPDRIVGLDENTNEIFVWGETTLQVYAPDETFTFGVVASREYGLSAPHSAIKKDQQFAFLDHRRRVIMSDGRGFDIISRPIQKTLEGLSRVDDCFGYWLTMGAADCLVWTFPTDGVTLVYQNGTWGRWTGWDTQNDLWTRFTVNAFHQRTDDNTPLAGTTDGRVAMFDWDAQTDLGTPIKSFVQTGYIDRGTDNRKRCEKVLVSLKRGHTTAANTPKLFIGFRDEPGDWQRLEVDLGASGDTEIVVPLVSLGVYRRRQWYLEFAGSEELVVAKVTEQFTVLEY